MPVTLDEKRRCIEYIINMIQHVTEENTIKLINELERKYGPDSINIVDKYGNTLLYYALEEKFKKLANHLINKGANINFINKQNGRSILQDFVISGLYNIADRAIELGADINAKFGKYENLLHYLASETKTFDFNKFKFSPIYYLVSKSANFNFSNKSSEVSSIIDITQKLIHEESLAKSKKHTKTKAQADDKAQASAKAQAEDKVQAKQEESKFDMQRKTRERLEEIGIIKDSESGDKRQRPVDFRLQTSPREMTIYSIIEGIKGPPQKRARV